MPPHFRRRLGCSQPLGNQTKRFVPVHNQIEQPPLDLGQRAPYLEQIMPIPLGLRPLVVMPEQALRFRLQPISLAFVVERNRIQALLLFAIQNLKPSPFCLLDEIEAALDDSNVGRFASYLQKLTKNTQFIIITHRRGTMNAADRLYGITMQEKGVSTLVSVDLVENQLTQ